VVVVQLIIEVKQVAVEVLMVQVVVEPVEW
jgi:hypothetical protein